ncbi:MAG: hypothetical protein AB9M53_04175 [Leptothrix sp. (in: b-proteobacteria)]
MNCLADTTTRTRQVLTARARRALAWLGAGLVALPLQAAPPKPTAASQAEAMRVAAAQVLTGVIVCDQNQRIVIQPAPQQPGLFQLLFEEERYLMTPVLSSSGAVRLEDKAHGLLWLQIGSKSMLMDERAHQRLADHCLHPAQVNPVQAAPLLIAPAPSR